MMKSPRQCRPYSWRRGTAYRVRSRIAYQHLDSHPQDIAVISRREAMRLGEQAQVFPAIGAVITPVANPRLLGIFPAKVTPPVNHATNEYS